MSNVSTTIATKDDDRQAALTWLRGVLTSAMEVSPLSYQQKKKANHFVSRIPDWLMASCAEFFNIDYVGGHTMYPDMAEQVKGDSGRDIAQGYLEAHDTVPAGFCLDQLGRRVLKLSQAGTLPIDADMVLRQVCALAWAECTEDGMAFARQASEILSDPENPNHPIIDYQIALERGEKDKLEQLDTILTGGRYGEWVDSRFDEAKRYLGVDTPVYRISFVERTPQWDALWEDIIKGGSND